ncbi:glycosyltransferase family 4 protein [Dietzia cercidiphylli]|uniref:glycosyltransferase family 4 protein n=1 Tax=Dietzia cercidiphylli TaxID=498199 RepID=UPI003F7DE941
MRLLIVVNVDWFFLSHRLAIANAAAAAGWDVHVATTVTQPIETMSSYDFTIHHVPMHRSSWNPVGLISALLRYLLLFWTLRPDVVHLVTIKPIILGGLAARLANISGVVYAVSGLGHVFIANGRIGAVRRKVVRQLYKVSMGAKNKVVIFQNSVDEAELVERNCVSPQEAVRLPGSGFDVDGYEVSDLPTGPPVFMMASRLIRTKGVVEFVEAAATLHDQGLLAEFWLVGAPDPSNPEGLSFEELRELAEVSNVKLWGHRDDVPEIMRSAAAVVLPSYYGEGLPKVLIEAAAAGRAVITTDTPGCRDAIVDGETGILVPARDSNRLADAMRQLATDRQTLELYGHKGRKRAESIFKIEYIVDRHLQIYERLVHG